MVSPSSPSPPPPSWENHWHVERCFSQTIRPISLAFGRLFVQPGHPTTPFYLNYLSGCDASCGGPVGGPWNGVSAALSADGIHFADEGQVIEKDEKAGWLGKRGGSVSGKGPPPSSSPLPSLSLAC